MTNVLGIELDDGWEPPLPTCPTHPIVCTPRNPQGWTTHDWRRRAPIDDCGNEIGPGWLAMRGLTQRGYDALPPASSFGES